MKVTYDIYKKRLETLASIRDSIIKHKILIISCLIAVFIVVSTLVGINGMILDPVVGETDLTYGERVYYESNSIFSKSTTEYKEKNDTQWTAGLPETPGEYEIRTVSERSFGATQHGKAVSVVIKKKDITISIVDNEIEYGTILRLTSDLAYADKIECDSFIFDDVDDNTFNVTPDIEKLKIINKEGLDVTDAYNIILETKAVDFTKKRITIDTESINTTYNGQTFELSQYDISSGNLCYSDSIDITPKTFGYNAGIYTNNMPMKILNKDGKDVTNKYYDVHYNYGRVNVAKIRLEIKTNDKTKTYDGTPLSDKTVIYDSSLLPQGEGFSFGDFKEITNASTIQNSVQWYPNDNTNLANYEIVPRFGTLKVEKAEITVNTLANKKTFDGLPLMAGFEHVEGTLYKDALIRISKGSSIPTLTYPGTLTNDLDIKIYESEDDYENGIESTNYKLKLVLGDLVVEKVKLKVTTQSKEKEYDGTALYSEDEPTYYLLRLNALTGEYEPYVPEELDLPGIYDEENNRTGTIYPVLAKMIDYNPVLAESEVVVRAVLDYNSEKYFTIVDEDFGSLKILKRIVTLTNEEKTVIFDDNYYAINAFEYIDGESKLLAGDYIDVSEFGNSIVGNYEYDIKNIKIRNSNGDEVSYYDVRFVEGKDVATLNIIKRAFYIKTINKTFTYEGVKQYRPEIIIVKKVVDELTNDISYVQIENGDIGLLGEDRFNLGFFTREHVKPLDERLNKDDYTYTFDLNDLKIYDQNEENIKTYYEILGFINEDNTINTEEIVTLTINPIELTIRITDVNVAFDRQAHHPTFELLSGSLLDGDIFITREFIEVGEYNYNLTQNKILMPDDEEEDFNIIQRRVDEELINVDYYKISYVDELDTPYLDSEDVIANLTIRKIDVYLRLDDREVEYSRANYMPTMKSVDLEGNLFLEGYLLTGDAYSDVGWWHSEIGTYTHYADEIKFHNLETGEDVTHHYQIHCYEDKTSVTLTIVPRVITIELQDVVHTYDREFVRPEIEEVISGESKLLENDYIDKDSYLRSEVGIYGFTNYDLKILNSETQEDVTDCYNVIYKDNKDSVTLTINKIDLYLQIIKDESYEYTKTSHAPHIKEVLWDGAQYVSAETNSSELLPDDYLTIRSFIEIGSYAFNFRAQTLTATIGEAVLEEHYYPILHNEDNVDSDASYYEIYFVDLDGNSIDLDDAIITFNITKRALMVTIEPSKTTTYTRDYQRPEISITSGSCLNGDSLNLAPYAKINPGVYNIDISDIEVVNELDGAVSYYDISFDNILSTLTIEKIDVLVTIEDLESSYTREVQYPKVSYEGNLISGDYLDLTPYGQTDIGTYDVDISDINIKDANGDIETYCYNITFKDDISSAQIIISKIEFKIGLIEYTFTYDGLAHDAGVIPDYAALLSGDSYSTSDYKRTDVGTDTFDLNDKQVLNSAQEVVDYYEIKYFAITLDGNGMPVDAVPVAQGNIFVTITIIPIEITLMLDNYSTSFDRELHSPIIKEVYYDDVSGTYVDATEETTKILTGDIAYVPVFSAIGTYAYDLYTNKITMNVNGEETIEDYYPIAKYKNNVYTACTYYNISYVDKLNNTINVENAQVTLEITKIDIVISIDAIYTTPYNRAKQNPNIKENYSFESNLLDGDSIDITPYERTDIGEYAIDIADITIVDANKQVVDYYQISFKDDNTQSAFEIVKRDIYIKLIDTQVSFDRNKHTPTIKEVVWDADLVQYVDAEESILLTNDYLYLSPFERIEVGEYTFNPFEMQIKRMAAEDPTYYEIHYIDSNDNEFAQGMAHVELIIKKIDIYYQLTDTTIIYDGKDHYPSIQEVMKQTVDSVVSYVVSFNNTNLLSGDTLDKEPYKGKEIGTYHFAPLNAQIKMASSLEYATYYNIHYVDSDGVLFDEGVEGVTLFIVNREIYVKAVDGNYIFNRQPHSPTFSVVKKVNDSYEPIGGSDVGLMDGDHFNVDYFTRTTIKSIADGDYVYEFELSELKILNANNEDVTSNYTILGFVDGDNALKDGSNPMVNLTINPVPVYLHTEDNTVTYDGNEKFVEISFYPVDGYELLPGDEVINKGFNGVGTYVYDVQNNTITKTINGIETVEEYYPIVSYNNYGERIPADYYQVLPVGPNPVTLTINPIHIYISIANAEYTYDGLKHSPDIHEVIQEEDEYNNVSYRDPLQDETNLVFGDKLNLAPYTTANVKDVQNADYVYSYSMIDFDLFMKGYYNVHFVKDGIEVNYRNAQGTIIESDVPVVTLTINPRVLNVAWDEEAEHSIFEYDGKAHTPAIVFGGDHIAAGEAVNAFIIDDALEQIVFTFSPTYSLSVKTPGDGYASMSNPVITYSDGTMRYTVTSNFIITYPNDESYVQVVPRKLVVAPKHIEVEYDGEVHTIDEYEFIEGSLVGGDELRVLEFIGEGTEIGEYTVEFGEYILDNADCYDVELRTQTLNIVARQIYIQISNIEYEYDAKEHTPNISEYIIDNTKLLGDDIINVAEFSKINAGEYVINTSDIKVLTYDADLDEYKEANYYAISFVDLAGTIVEFSGINLIIHKKLIYIRPSNASLEYTGEMQTAKDIEEILVDGIVDGKLQKVSRFVDGHYMVVNSVTFGGGRLELGLSENETYIIDYDISVFDGSDGDEDETNDVDVSENYEYNIDTKGNIEIIKRKITIKTGSKYAVYSGTPLMYDHYIIESGSVLEGDQLAVEIYGRIVDIGSVPNKASAKVYGEHEEFYEPVNIIFGTLTIVADEKDMPEDPEEDNIQDWDENFDYQDNNGADKESVLCMVTSDVAGSIYLKTESYANYTGSTWNAEDSSIANRTFTYNEKTYSYNALTGLALNDLGVSRNHVTIKSFIDGALVPYYTDMEYMDPQELYTLEHDGFGYEIEYRDSTVGILTQLSQTTQDLRIIEQDYRMSNLFRSNYLTVPDGELKQYLISIINSQGFTISDSAIIQKVAQYIQNSAKYNLAYDPALDEESDFVYAFLTKYKEGVCRHYASAATLLYRTLGIPARLVVGLKGEVTEPNTKTSITKKQAHAWVEVYVYGLGWIAVEVTGSDSNSSGGASGSGSNNENSQDSDISSTVNVEDYFYDKEMYIHPVFTLGSFDPLNPDAELSPKQQVESYEFTNESGVYVNKGLFENLISKGYTYECEILGGQVGVGISRSKIMKFKLFDSYGNDVTNRFIIHMVDGQVEMTDKEIIVINVKNYIKTYTGQEISPKTNAWTIVSQPSNVVIEWTMQSIRGPIVNAGVIKAADLNVNEICVYSSSDVFRTTNIAQNYRIVVNGNAVVVKPKYIAISTNSISQLITNGSIHQEVFLSQGTLVSGHRIACTFVTPQQIVGVQENKISELHIYDENGNDVTGSYSIKVTYGQIKLSLDPNDI